jgi:hypothetical protein
MAKHNLPCYRSSGRVSPLTLALFAGVIAGSLVAACIYQQLMNWIPFIQLKFIMTFAFAGGIGAGAMWAVKRGHCRNALVAGVLALVASAAGVAASHYYNFTRSEFGEQLSFGEYLEARRDTGWKMSRGGKVDGPMVTILWALEGLIVAGIAGFMSAGAAGNAYCEKCGTWCEDKSYTVWGVSSADAEPLIQRGDLTALADISGKSGDANVNLTFAVASCPRCNDTGFLTLHEKRTSTDKKGRQQQKGNKLLALAVLTPEQLTHARERASFSQGQKLPA